MKIVHEKIKMDTNLPETVSFNKFVASTLSEIKAINTELGKCSHGARAFQKLPRHMQRRAVSTNPKRLPRCLRDKNQREIGNKIRLSKRPSRKYRRRPSNIVEEHNKRAASSHWLETHVWHAKRFHMEKHWGHSLPQKPTNKGYRSTLRAAKNKCLIQDVSYESCFEFDGPTAVLTEALQSYISPEDHAKLSLCSNKPSTTTWTEIHLYQQNRFPFGAIGFLKLYWHPSQPDSNSRLWMWTHPSTYDDVLSSLITMLALEAEDPSKYVSTDTKVSLTNYRSKLNKFRVTGPMAHSVLSKVLLPTTVDAGDECEQTQPWWRRYFRSPECEASNAHQMTLWESYAQHAPSGPVVLGFSVRDTRLIPPPQKAFCEQQLPDSDQAPPPSANDAPPYFPILDATIRDAVSSTLIANHQINELRAANVIPGMDMAITQEETRIPVLLMYTPASRLSQPSWDLILPAKVGAFTWVALYLNGGVAAGQEQEYVMEQEFLLRPNANSYPDTSCGRLQVTHRTQHNELVFFKKPPNCRFNYMKLGVLHPFGPPWLKLMQSLNAAAVDYCCLRDPTFLTFLSQVTCPRLYDCQEPDSKKRKLDDVPQKRSLTKDMSHIAQDSLVYCRFVMAGKGSCEDNAMLCIPTDEDLKNCYESEGLLEPIHEDARAKERDSLKQHHAKQKKRKRRLNKVHNSYVRERKLSATTEQLKNLEALAVPKVQEFAAEYESFNPTMQSLWVSPPEAPLQNGTRQIVGYATKGTYINAIGRTGGLAWIAMSPLLNHMIRTNVLTNTDNLPGYVQGSQVYDLPHVRMLLRNPSSLVYRWVRLIVLDV